MTYNSNTPPWEQNPPQTEMGGRRTRFTLGSLPHCPHLKKRKNKTVKHWLCSTRAPHPTHSSVCGDPPICKGGPKAASHHSSFTLVCSWQLRALVFLPPLAQSLPRLLSLTRTFSLISKASLPQDFWGSSFSGIFSPPARDLPGLSAQDVGFTQLPHSP